MGETEQGFSVGVVSEAGVASLATKESFEDETAGDRAGDGVRAAILGWAPLGRHIDSKWKRQRFLNQHD